MSIVPLRRVTLYGLLAEKPAVLRDLQELGCLHPVALAEREGEEEGEEAAAGPSPAARNALKYLLTCRQRRRQVHDTAEFDAEAVQEEALAIQRRTKELEDERDALERRIGIVEPWGDFALPPAEALGGIRLWFYVVPHYRLRELAAAHDHPWQVVRRDNRFSYVVVLAREAPAGLPVERVDLETRPLSALTCRLEAVEIELEDLQARRSALIRWCDLFARSLARLEDRAALADAAHRTRDDAPVFAIQGWAPDAAIPDVAAYADAWRLALVVEEPTPEDAPPTLMTNPEPVAGGQELVSFYSTPGYWNWDPSPAVFASFALFFAMILSDAGYALLFGAIVALFWRRLGISATRRRMRRLFFAMAGAGIV